MDTEAAMRALGWYMSIGEYGRGAKGGKSAGVAVGAKARSGMSESMLLTPPDDGCAHRFATKLVGVVLPDGVHCGSLYCISGIGLAAQANVDLLEAASKRLALRKGPWVVGGDFNGTAEELRKTGWLDVVKGTITQPSGSTCSLGSCRTIDFFV